MSRDTKWIIGTVVGTTVAATGVIVTVVAVLIGGVNARIDRLEAGVRSMDNRLRAVEIIVGKAVERAVVPTGPRPPAELDPGRSAVPP